MPLLQSRADAVWEGDLTRGAGRFSVASGAIPEQNVTFSARTESHDGKTSPEELIAAAHAVCYSMAFSGALARSGTPPERLEVSALCTLDRVEGGLKITTMELTVRGNVPGIDSGKFQELAEGAKQNCPVSKALQGNVDIRMKVELAA